ncbi:MAG TPA: O-antigen ligase family protein [Thermoleophilia bacterium]|nr:O-antigen ligase family protein [Thermoleophilia bacterium]
MVLAKIALAAALLAWFLWKARANRLFLLGIPVLMVMGESVFFNRMRPFWIPGRLEPQTHIFVWLCIVWVLIVVGARRGDTARTGPFGPGRLLPEETPLLLIAALIAVQAIVAGAGSGDFAAGVFSAADLAYLVIGYLLVRGIASQFSRAETIEFLGAVVIANTIAAGLYIIHQGLGASIYTGGEYFTTLFRGVEITRTFHFAPQFTILALGFILARSRWTAGWLLVLAISVLSVLVSYTRTPLIAVMLAFVISLVVRELRQPSAARLVRRALVIGVSAVVIVAGFAVVLPAQSQFINSRFSEFASASGASDIGNWQVRQFKYNAVEDVVLKSDPYFGMGFPAPGSNPVDAQVYRYSADMTWIPILYYTGYVGLALFGLLLLGFAVRTVRLASSPDETRRYLGLTYLIVICLTVLIGFTTWTFMEPRVAALGLWPLALVAAEALRPEDEREVAESSELAEASVSGSAMP